MRRKLEHRPDVLGPRPRCQDQLLTDRDRPLARDDRAHRLVRVELERLDLDACQDLHALGAALADEAHHGVLVEGESALVLVKERRDALRPPVRKEILHVGVDLALAGHEGRPIADPLLPLVGLGEIAVLHGRAERHVSDGVVVVRDRVGLPDLHARLHELGHRGLVVVVPDDPARDARGARARLRFLEHDDVGTRAETAGLELLGEVVAGRQAVDAGADDDVGRGCGKRHLFIASSAMPCQN